MVASGPATIDALSQLRDYRLPEPVAWWPPAPGWWLLLVLLALSMVALLAWWRRRRARYAAARQAMRELDKLRQRYADDPGDYLRHLSTLLRRYALTIRPRSEVAGITGEAWLAFLDRNGGDGRFAGGPGRYLLDAPYRKDVDAPVEQVAELVAQWIGRNREAGS